MENSMKQNHKFGDKVTDVCDTPERDYIVLKRCRANKVLVIDKKLQTYEIHKLRLYNGWGRKLKRRWTPPILLKCHAFALRGD